MVATAVGLSVPLTATEYRVMMSEGDEVPSGRAMTGSKLDSLVRLVVQRTPFRASRRPAPVAFDPNPPAAPTVQTGPKPLLTLSGIVWGADPTAVIQGVPGIEGSKVVRRGDVVGGIRVSRIEREHVWLTGLDTAWTLAVRVPWK
jgi:hypothetical protein